MFLQELKRLRYEDPGRFPAQLWERLAAERIWPISKAEHASSMMTPEHASEVLRDDPTVCFFSFTNNENDFVILMKYD